MLTIFIFLCIAGMVMTIWPDVVWRISEKWKSSDATEASNLYIVSTRIGGIICVGLGLTGLLFYFL